MQMRVIQLLEKGFERLGRFIARKPFLVILCCLVFTGICAIGFLNLRLNSDIFAVWDTNPSRRSDGSQAVVNRDWISNRFEDDKRAHTLIFKATEPNGNILTPKALKVMLDIHQLISRPLQNVSFSDICYRIPVPDIFGQRDKTCVDSADGNVSKNNSENSNKIESEYDYDYNYDYYQEEYNTELPTTGVKECDEVRNFNGSVFEELQRSTYRELPHNVYCELIGTFESQCLEQSLLEIWMYNERIIDKLTEQDVINAVNVLDRSPYFGFKYNYAELLGSIERNQTGHIVSATAALYNLVTVVDLKNIQDPNFLEKGAGPQVSFDEANIVWQDEAIKILLEQDKIYSETKDVTIDLNMAKSVDDLTGGTIFLDFKNVVFCFLIMYIYTSVMLNASSWSDMRLFLTSIGLFSVVLGVIIANGLVSALGYDYMPHFAMLPFLMVGLGIDDMFVIMQVYRNLGRSTDTSLEDKIGLTLKHAGVAISVTSLTDVCAFGVGAITVFPALQAFCVACSLGIAAIYFLQVTWFVAWLVLDEKRHENNSKCFPTFGKGSAKCSESKCSFSFDVWSKFSGLLDCKIYQVFIVIISATTLGFGIWGCIRIRQEFKLSRLYPANSYLRKFGSDFYEHFHDWELGFSIYTGVLQDENDFIMLDNMTKTLSHWIENDDVVVHMDNWWQEFNNHILDYWNITDWKTLFEASDEKDLQYYISEFLHSPNGGKYIANLRFNETLNCIKPSPQITASIIPIKFYKDEKSEDENDKRIILDNYIRSLNTTEEFFSHGVFYFIWDVNQHVGFELWRNLGVAVMCIFVVTLLLFNNFVACILVNLSVICTIVDVVGFVQFWDIQIDVVSLCTIVVVVGICVDYPVHILHSFLISKGTKIDRAKHSLRTIGPAVMNGGTTTFLSVIMFCGSQSHLFITFWKIFCLTVIFGLFHGILLLPVVLCYIGPRATKLEDQKEVETIGKINKGLETNESV